MRSLFNFVTINSGRSLEDYLIIMGIGCVRGGIVMYDSPAVIFFKGNNFFFYFIKIPRYQLKSQIIYVLIISDQFIKVKWFFPYERMENFSP